MAFVVALAGALSLGPALTQPAQAAVYPGECADMYQIGATSTVYSSKAGMTAASVKQYYSPACNKNFGYIYMWKQYRDWMNARNYDWTAVAAVYSPDTGYYYGTRDIISNPLEVWSYGASTVNLCTRAYGSFTVSTSSGSVADGASKYTELRC